MAASISGSDAVAVLDLITATAQIEDLDAWAVDVVPLLNHLISADAVSLEEIDLGSGRRRLTAVPQDVIQELDEDAFNRNIGQHPILSHQRTRGDFAPIRFSDLVSPVEWHRRDLYQEHFRPLGFEHQLATTLVGWDEVIVGVAFQRSQRDFSVRERDVLTAAWPHLCGQYRSLQARTLLAAAADLLSEDPENGSVHAVARETRKVSAGLPTVGSKAVPPPTIRRLSLRELEVLELLALGLADQEVAIRLEISRHTARRHAEHIYSKLGVRNRTEAVRRLLDETGQS